MCFLILFHSMNLMCFADHLNSLLLTFCSLCFILSLLLCFVQNLLFLKVKATQTHFSFYVFDFNLSNVPNKISSTHTRLLNFQEFSNPPPFIKFWKIFQRPTPCLFHYPHPSFRHSRVIS